MVKLTEDMVVARSKGSELHNIKKLNCWGSELTNVAVVRNLPNVEVLSLSVNQISSLEDFQFCGNLQELYIRKNNIKDINEVLYLRQIPKLKSLWLADNPCANFEEYRSTVLRALPHLQKLDNVAVEPEEVQQAMVLGLHLPLPNSNIRGPESTEIPRSNSAGDSLSDSSPLSSHPHQGGRQSNGYNQSLDEGYEYTRNVYDEDDEQPPLRRTSMASQHDPDPYERKTSAAYSSQARNSRYYETPPSSAYENDDGRGSSSNEAQHYPPVQRRQTYGGSNRAQPHRQGSPRRSSQNLSTQMDPETPMETRPFSRSSSEYVYDSHNANYVSRDENYPSRRTSRDHQFREQSWTSDSDGYRERGYARSDDGERPSSQRVPQRDSYAGRQSHQDYGSRTPGGEMRHFAQRPSAVGEALQQHYDSTYRRVDQQIDAVARSSSAVDRPSPTRPYPLRPKTRNANVLSAVLCLIKELDYSSLEVVEMAVRCRMDEFDD